MDRPTRDPEPLGEGLPIVNKTFESTVAVRQTDIEDDRIGVFKPAFAEMAQSAKRHPEELVFGLLQSGFTANCYDEQYFFDTDHPVVQADTSVASVSNMQAGSGPGWYLLDCSREVRPLIWQERIPYEFQQLTQSTGEDVFTHDEYVYGVRARVNAGFGLWQLAFGSKAALNPANYQLARAAMMGFAADGGRTLGVMPTVMVVPPALEADARYLLATDIQPSGGSNPWKGSCDLIVTPYPA